MTSDTYVWDPCCRHVVVQVGNFLVVFVTIATELEAEGPIGREHGSTNQLRQSRETNKEVKTVQYI